MNLAYRHGLIAVLGLMPCAALAAPGNPVDPRQLTSGRVTVTLSPRPPGLRIAFGGVAVSTASEIVVTTPPWAPHFYVGPEAAAVRDATLETEGGAQRLRIVHQGQNGSFTGTEVIEVTPDGRVEQVFEGKLSAETPEALIQIQLAALNPAVLVGCRYRAKRRDDAERSGVVPVAAASAEVGPSTLAKDFRWIEFESRLGPIRIELDTEHAVTLYDHRRSRWANEKHPFFYLGDLGTRFRGGESVRYRVVYQFPTQPEAIDEAAYPHVDARIQPRASAQMPAVEDPPYLIPRPKEAEYPKSGTGELGFVMDKEPVIRVAPEPFVEQRAAVQELTRFLQEEAGVNPPSVPGSEVGTTHGIILETVPVEAASRPEGYELTVHADHVRIRARDANGHLNAVQTLKQLATVTPEGRPMFRAANIRDWPSLPFRGVHLFTGSKGNALHKSLIRDVLAALKMNTLVLEAEYIRWDSHPELHHPDRGMDKGEVRELVELCKAQNIEIIPLINTLGHAQWMFHGDVNLDLAEDPEAQWAYCVTNPKTYDFVFDIFRETLELFTPKTLHIGHDEFTHRGRYPFREESKKHAAEELLMMDTLKLHGWLKDRGVRTMLWGDMFLGKGEGPDATHAASPESAAKLRGELPKDVIVADWHYIAGPAEGFVNLDKFHEAGLETVASTWDRPDNILNFARAAHDKKSRGLLQTTWAGYSLDPESFQKELSQYVAYVLAAEAAWNADRPPPDRRRLAWRFFDLMGMSGLKPARRAGWTADLKPARNLPVAATDASGWFGLGTEYDLSAVPRGVVRLNGVEFDLGEAADPAAIVLRSKLARDPALPRGVEITVGAKAEQLLLLHTTPFVCPAGEAIGRAEMAFAAGAPATVEVIYGRNILAAEDQTAAAECPAMWWGSNRAWQPVSLRALVWPNPRPDQAIRTIKLESAGGSSPWVVLAITGLTETLPVAN